MLNPATPYGDCSLIRMVNLHANVLQVRHPRELRECFAMLTERSARLLNLKDYGLAVGNPADIVLFDAKTPEQAIAQVHQRVEAVESRLGPELGAFPVFTHRVQQVTHLRQGGAPRLLDALQRFAILGRTGPQRRCPTCGSWIDWPEATNGV